MEIINSFKRYLKAIVPEIVYKSSREAEQSETEASRLAGDEYVSAVLQTDSFLSYSSYSTAVLNQVGIFDEHEIELINLNKNRIPEDKRDKVVEAKRREIITNYEELNNYYRRLSGLPNLNDPSVYVDPRDLNVYGYYSDSIDDYDNDRLDKLTPLHLLPQNTLNAMDKAGYLLELYNTYNGYRDYDAEYIKYTGLRKISIVMSRTAGHYELLYTPRPDNANRFHRDFTLYYEEARQYFLTQVYNYHYTAQYDFYEGYIGFFIMVMAIERMINSLFEVMVERDFYDVETCRMFLEAYGIPFMDIFNFTQQKALVKNLNILLMNKCTSQVLYDILDLLDYNTFELTKYLLVKQHKTVQQDDESEPKPVFVYRLMLDKDYQAVCELDKGKMYDYYFVGVDMNEKDIKLADITNAYSKSYEEVTQPDELWLEDDELIEMLEKAEINYTETKYMSVSVTLKLQEYMFEHIYLQKMLCDKALETSKIQVDIPLITQNLVSLLELEVILICLLCKHDGVIPDLLTSPSKILAVLGFNFDADLESIKEDIKSHPEIYNQKLLSYIENIHFLSASDVNEMYRNTKMLHELLIEGMQNTQNPIVYHAYKKLYNTLLVTDVHNEVFTLPNGELPETYMDWLEINDPFVYTYIDNLTSEECVDKINYIVTKMSTMFTDTKYLSYLNPIDKTVVEGVLRLLRWFKSYTLDIRDMEVVYLFDSNYYNLMKMMSRLYFHTNSMLRETDIGFHDWTNSFHAVLRKKEIYNKLMDILRVSSKFTYKQLDSILKESVRVSANGIIRTFELYHYIDKLISTVSRFICRDKMNMTDTRRPIKIIIED